MIKQIAIKHKTRIVDGVIDLPASKSITNRVMIISELAKEKVFISGIAEAHDSVNLSANLSVIRKNTGSPQVITIDVGAAGTNMRFLTSFLAVADGEFIITGTKRMLCRPIAPLVDALKKLGAEISYEKEIGFPPLRIKGKKLYGGSVEIDSSISSQFISSLMMIGSKLSKGLTIVLKGNAVSKSYIKMTARLMKQFGVDVNIVADRIIIPKGKYFYKGNFVVEKDWSAASYWFAIAALAGKSHILLKNLKPDSIQGDAVLPELYSRLGVTSVATSKGLLLTKTQGFVLPDSFLYNFTDCPDIAQTLIATVAGMKLKGLFSGLKTLRIKETDRISAMIKELSKMNVICSFSDDSIAIQPSVLNVKSAVNTYHDHRMAMCLAPLALKADVVRINNPDVVIKSYPAFWDDLKKIGFNLLS